MSFYEGRVDSLPLKLNLFFCTHPFENYYTVVAHGYNLSYLEVEIRRIEVQGEPQKKISETPISTKKMRVVIRICHASYMGGINRRIVVNGGFCPRQKH
jgi:hypothetical protein